MKRIRLTVGGQWPSDGDVFVIEESDGRAEIWREKDQTKIQATDRTSTTLSFLGNGERVWADLKVELIE
jgi:hypothetical protein